MLFCKNNYKSASFLMAAEYFMPSSSWLWLKFSAFLRREISIRKNRHRNASQIFLEPGVGKRRMCSFNIPLVEMGNNRLIIIIIMIHTLFNTFNRVWVGVFPCRSSIYHHNKPTSYNYFCHQTYKESRAWQNTSTWYLTIFEYFIFQIFFHIYIFKFN